MVKADLMPLALPALPIRLLTPVVCALLNGLEGTMPLRQICHLADFKHISVGRVRTDGSLGFDGRGQPSCSNPPDGGFEPISVVRRPQRSHLSSCFFRPRKTAT